MKSAFINKYTKAMTKEMSLIFPDLTEDEIKKTISKMIEKSIEVPMVSLHNNYTGEEKYDVSMLSVLDWCFDRKPIICGNGTFYKNQLECINPIAQMLTDFLSQRKAYKKEMFKVEDPESPEYKDFDRLQGNEKVNCNSYYGASGAPSSAFYSEFSGPATTNTAQQVISTAEQLFEGFIADNYIFLNLTEAIEWCDKALKGFKKDYNDLYDDFLQLHNIYETRDRILEKILNREDDDEIILEKYLSSLSDQEVSLLYYKNNLQGFIEDHEIIQNLLYTIFTDVENLEYANKNDEGWMKLVPDKYINDMRGKTYKDWNKFVNKHYFMDPNDVPESVKYTLETLKDYLMKYVYCRYLSFDRIYRLKNFKRRVVTVIDTDSNILSLDTIVKYIMKKIVHGESFGRSDRNNIFICVNTLAFVLTSVVTDILLTYGEFSNVPEEYRPIYNMKNEFLFLKLVIGKTKKRYISKIVLREGNLMDPPKYDIKGFDFKKATCSEYAEEFYMSLLKKYVINCDGIELKSILKELKEFTNEIRESVNKGERTYLPNASAKELGAYKNPESEQSVKGVLAWNMLTPDNQIELPSKVSLLKLNIFSLDDIKDLKNTNPEIYNIIEEKIFNDTSGMFVKYDKNGKRKSVGMQVIAIPSNASIPDWIKPYIDMGTLINNIISPFIPVLDIFKSKTVEEGKSRNGTNRKTDAFTNIVKF